MPWQAALHLHTYGTGLIAYFALSEWINGGPHHTAAKMWGNTIRWRTAGHPQHRPQWFGLKLLSDAELDEEIACPLSGAPLEHYAGDRVNGGQQGLSTPVPALTIPLLSAICFREAAGPRRSMVLFNLDQTEAHSVRFAGSVPSAPVAGRRFAPGVTTLNEATTAARDNWRYRPTMAIEKLPGIDPSAGLNLPPASMTVLEWSAARR
jgi:hypothetical protein